MHTHFAPELAASLHRERLGRSAELRRLVAAQRSQRARRLTRRAALLTRRAAELVERAHA